MVILSRRTKKQDIYVISTLKRPVPLEHYLYAGNDLFKVVDSQKKFLPSGYKEAKDSLSRAGRDSGWNSRGKMAVQKTDRNTWVLLVGLLRKRNLLPTVVFSFSKKKCDEYADALSNVDLTTASEKSEVHLFIEKSLLRLRGTDKELPQVARMRQLLARGIAVHHGGLLPIIKEVYWSHGERWIILHDGRAHYDFPLTILENPFPLAHAPLYRLLKFFFLGEK